MTPAQSLRRARLRLLLELVLVAVGAATLVAALAAGGLVALLIIN